MGLMNTLMKAGVAQKVIQEARKPQNQAKAKSLFQKVSAKYSNKQARPR